MRSRAVPSNPSAGDVTSAVLAIGCSDFPNVLIDTLRRQAEVGHCMVFALSRAGAADCLLDAGNIPIGGDLGAAYAGQFHESDPNRDALFATRAPLAALTPREQEVCRRILSGSSSEAISQALGISLHSTLTYRKRAYERLGISSQSELFAIVLRLLTPSLN